MGLKQQDWERFIQDPVPEFPEKADSFSPTLRTLLPPSGQVRAAQRPDPGTPGSPPLGGTRCLCSKPPPETGSWPCSPGCHRQPRSSGVSSAPCLDTRVRRTLAPPAGRREMSRPSPGPGPRSEDSNPPTACCCAAFHSESGSGTLEDRKHNNYPMKKLNNIFFLKQQEEK